ncbi:MAG: hypothetical protein ACRDS1_06625 [Pseudonocardiaceae bacterium]
MSDLHHDGSCKHDKTPLPVTYAAAVEAIREATSRMRLAREVPERLDAQSLAAIAATLMDITKELAQFAGQVDVTLPDLVDQHLMASQEIRDGLIAFRIAVLDASVAARSIESSAASVSQSAVPRQRRR